MDNNMIARCGIDCSECGYKEQFNCSGCKSMDGKMFWGECKVAACCMDKSHEHCGKCDSFVCETLHAFAYDQDQGDNGKRLENLKKLNNAK